MSDFDLKKFREEFLQSDGWKVSDCYKPYDDKFLRKDAQDAYEGAKWGWVEQQKKIDEVLSILNDVEMDNSESMLDSIDQIKDLLK